MAAHFTRVEFKNFKALSSYSLGLREMSILVGPNNCGKSTILSAFRALEAGLRRANARRAELVEGPAGERFGYELLEDSIPLSLENVHTDYEERDSLVTFSLSNGNRLLLFFPRDGGARLIPEVSGPQVRRPVDFRREFPVSIAIVPVLGPIEHEEEVRNDETVRRNLMSHRASSHFRNYWYHFPDHFSRFADLVASTWPGMTVQLPERVTPISPKLIMICEEDRIARELYWAGFGFQVWCQLLTHIVRAEEHSLLVVDEPEIYLHPDVQRQLLGVLRDTGADVLLASHSTEIMGEADPSEIVLVDKSRRAGERLRDVEGVQKALDLVGSVQNITLTQLARTQRMVFVEGLWDWGVLRRFAKKVGLPELASGSGLTPFESKGFSSWDRIKSLAWGFDSLLDSGVRIATVFDRDFWCEEELDHIRKELLKHVEYAHFHARKELENYLLLPSVLERALESSLRERESRTGKRKDLESDISVVIDDITRPERLRLQGQYVTKEVEFLKTKSRKDPSVLTTEATARFEAKWNDVETRMQLVEGKETLASVRHHVQQACNVTLTDLRIIDSFLPHEIPEDLMSLLRYLDGFRAG